MTKQQIIKKTEDMFIQADPRLSDRNYRLKMPMLEKMKLVQDMINVGQKIEILNS